MLWFWKPCRHWGTDVRHAFKGVALTGRLERLVERHRVPTVLNTAFPNHKIGFHNSIAPQSVLDSCHCIEDWIHFAISKPTAGWWLIVGIPGLRCKMWVPKSSYFFAAWRCSSWEQSSPGWLLWTRPLVLQLNPCFKIDRVSEFLLIDMASVFPWVVAFQFLFTVYYGISCEALFERACAQADELDFDFKSGCGHHQRSHPKQLLGLGLSHPLPSILLAITCSGIPDWIHSGCCPHLPHLRLDFLFSCASKPSTICAF